MDISISMDTGLVVGLLLLFIALRVWHPVTSCVGRLKKKKKTNE